MFRMLSVLCLLVAVIPCRSTASDLRPPQPNTALQYDGIYYEEVHDGSFMGVRFNRGGTARLHILFEFDDRRISPIPFDKDGHVTRYRLDLTKGVVSFLSDAGIAEPIMHNIATPVGEKYLSIDVIDEKTIALNYVNLTEQHNYPGKGLTRKIFTYRSDKIVRDKLAASKAAERKIDLKVQAKAKAEDEKMKNGLLNLLFIALVFMAIIFLFMILQGGKSTTP